MKIQLRCGRRISLLTISIIILTLIVLAACSPKIQIRKEGPSIEDLLKSHPKIMWVAAHPDDEASVGAIMAKARFKYDSPVYFLVLTRGDGGECCIKGGCHPDLATVRAAEMKNVAELYGATLQHETYFNAPLPVETFPPRHEIAKRWLDKGDPTLVIAKAIRSFKPDIVLMLSPTHGGSGHPEHQLASRFALAAIRLSSQNNPALEGEPYRVPNTYFLLNKYWIARCFAKEDPEEPNDVFYVLQKCTETKQCWEVMAEFSRPHQSQAHDMGGMRFLAKNIKKIYLRKVDPFNDSEIKDPFEKAAKGGMD